AEIPFVSVLLQPVARAPRHCAERVTDHVDGSIKNRKLSAPGKKRIGSHECCITHHVAHALVRAPPITVSESSDASAASIPDLTPASKCPTPRRAPGSIRRSPSYAGFAVPPQSAHCSARPPVR